MAEEEEEDAPARLPDERADAAARWAERGLQPPSERPLNLFGRQPRDAVDAIVRWFFENFEDPVHHTPYNGREGGYLYLWGPYDAREILEEVFEGIAPDDVVMMAIDEIQGDGTEWVPAISRVIAPDDGRLPRTTEALHAEMQDQIRELQGQLAKAEQALAGIGHNHPPEALADEALSRDDRRELAGALTTLANQPAVPADQGAAAIEASATIASKRSKLRKWLAGLGPTIATGVASMVAEESLKAIWLRLSPAIEQAMSTIAQWLASLPF